jgi:hypothetical protein
MRTSTLLHLGLIKPTLRQLLVVTVIFLLTPFLSYSLDNNFRYYYEDSCEELEELFFTGNATFSSLRIDNPVCCDNATSPTDGQFTSFIELFGLSGATWYIDDAIGVYEGLEEGENCEDIQPVVPFDFGPGGSNNIFEEQENLHPSMDSSRYYLPIITVHGEPNLVRIKSSMGDIITVISESKRYKSYTISGATSVCTGMIASYSSPSPEMEGEWVLPEGGGVIDGPDGNSTTIVWGMVPGVYPLMFTGEVNCYAPTIIYVAVGMSTGKSMNCKGPQNISLGADCELQLTPGMILGGEIDVEVPYSVMILDKYNKAIPYATFTTEHIGGTYTVKVFDACSGNSCWSELTIEDKLKPVISCSTIPDTLYCYKKDQRTLPLAYDNCSEPVEVLLIDSIFLPMECNADFVGKLKKTFVAVDEAGNYSEECDQYIMLRRIVLDDITPPENHLINESNGITCKEYMEERLPNGDLDPAYFGVPSIDGVPLWPNIDLTCKVTALYTDKDGGTIGGAGNVKKVIRTWKIYDWNCPDAESKKFTQMIEVEDSKPPVIKSAPDSLTFSANSGKCEAYGYFPPIEAVEDDCFDTDVHVRIDGILNTNGGYAKLSQGIHFVDYIVTDNRGNADTITVKVKVIDLTSPVAVCIQYMVIGLDEYGQAVLPAEAVNNGSNDACGIDYVEVRRMDDTVSCQDTIFSPYVEFCCEDSGKRRMVELRVWDINGNSNTCMAEIEVQDKYLPQIGRLPGFEILCGDDLRLDALEVPEVLDACAVMTTDTLIYDLNDCGVGTITRRFTATDANGTAVMEQLITVTNVGVFEMSPDDWPADVDTVAVCDVGDLEPDDLPPGAQRPYIPYDMCSDVYVTHTDDLYRFSDENVASCFKILRRWTVIDWCQKDEEGDPRRWEYEQVIKVSNTDSPEIISVLEDLKICSDDCPSGFISLSVIGKDSCTADDDLRWSYRLDLNDDGIVDETKNGKGNTASIEGDYIVGSHSIVWIFSDQCGNTATGSQKITIKSCKAPQLVLLKDVAVGLTPMDLVGNDQIPDDEMACINVDSLEVSSIHPCGTPFELSFSADSIVKEMCFNCLDIGKNQVWVYGIDTCGNIDSIYVMVDVQDNNNEDVCESPRGCIIFPPDLDISECMPDLSPGALGSRPIIDPDCICLDTMVSFSDQVVDDPGIECTAIIRTWSVTFNCGLRPLVYEEQQKINVLNSEAPEIVCPDTIRMDAAMDSCEVFVQMSEVTAIATCNSGVIITNDYNGGGADASDVYPVGETKVKFVAVDSCANADTCYVTVIVRDNVDPECDPMDDITITISGGTSFTILDPSSIDNGSSDNCAIDRFELSDSTFTCDQIGIQNLTTTFIVYDVSGNSSECEVNVTVEDGGMLTCEAIPNLTVYLNEMGMATITPADIDGGSGAGCEIIPELSIDRDKFICDDVTISPIEVILKVKIANDSLECATMVTVKDTILPTGTILENSRMINCDDFSGDIKMELDGVFGIADNCDSSTVTIDTVITNMTNICGDGDFVVKLIMTDICGNVDSTGEVLITIVNDNPFTVDSILFPKPDIINLESCGDISPEALGSNIVINDDEGICSNVISFYVDDTLNFNFFCSDTIRRIWTVQDSCQLDEMGAGMWQDTQFIVINDVIPPVVVGPPDMTITNANSTSDCAIEVVLMSATATDNCTPADEIELTNNSPFAIDPLSGDISGDYDPGIYIIQIYGEDLCGNVDTFEVMVTVEEPSGQGFQCRKVITTIFSNLTGVSEANDFVNFNAPDNCFNPEDLVFSFNRNDPTDNTRIYTCDDVGTRSPGNPLGLDVVVYSFDMGVLMDSCMTTVAIADFNNNCPDNSAQVVSGEIFTYDGNNIEGVLIELEGDVNQVFKTDASGSYAFTNLLMGLNFDVVPYKNDDVLNGVSTLDLIKIQRHILGLEEFNNSFQYVAADINNNKSISVADILELRKVILGIYDEFSKNTSWRMVDGNFNFPQNVDPLSVVWPETYKVQNLDSFMDIDFVGIKVGDVDGDAKSNSRSDISTRSNIEVSLGKENLINGFAFKSLDDQAIYGFQMSIYIGYGFIDLTSELPQFNASNYAQQNGILNISWSTDQPVKLKNGDVLFTINGTDIAELAEDIIKPAIYLSEGGGIENYALNMQDEIGTELKLFSNTPNPWSDYTEINFTINYVDDVVINFYDSSGKLLSKRMFNTNPGINKIRIQKDDLQSSGLIIYEIISNKEKSQGKMILVK